MRRGKEIPLKLGEGLYSVVRQKLRLQEDPSLTLRCERPSPDESPCPFKQVVLTQVNPGPGSVEGKGSASPVKRFSAGR